MTLTQRRLYFALLAIIFLIGTPMIILYSSGYRMNWSMGNLEKTGGVYVGAYPKGADIFVDEKLKDTTSTLLFSQGKLISGLTPGKHMVTVKKSGWAAWEKSLSVEPNLVSEARNIFLVPLEKQATVIAESINDFVLSDSEALLAFVQKDGITVVDALADKKTVVPQHPGEYIGKISFGSDEDSLIVESFFKNKTRKYVTNTATKKIIDIPEDELEKYIKLKQYPGGQKKLLALSDKNALYAIDLNNPADKTVLAKNVSNFELFGTKVLYATIAPTILYEKDLVSGEITQITQTPIENFDSSAKMLRSGDGHIAIIDNKKTLFLYDNDNAVFNQIARTVVKAVFSPDKKKLLYQNRNEIYITYLRDSLIQPYRKKGDTEFITRFSRPIQNSEWFAYDNEHILFATEGKLKLTELDGRDERNTQDVVAAQNLSKIKYNSYDDYIYFLDGTTLKKISLLEKNK